ncbi:MAG TPA: MFS transporter [Rhodospirillales bacterium]|jgi:DHA1 family tetracycline resistance protein-like MFS transporter|nr:MFS transporter [Rhodospirillales bacterium]HJO70091.1 MFS transporter [Rhodospirillales bacterium]
MVALFLVVLIDLIGFGIIIPLLPFYGEHFHAEPDTVALLMASYSFTQFLSAPLWGGLSDRIGRRPVLLMSLAGATVSYIWLGMADSLWMLFAARSLGGAMAGNIAAAFAYVADVTPPEGRAKGMGLIGAAFGLGFMSGPAIGGILAGPDPASANFHLPAFAAAGLSIAALLAAVFFLRESLAPEARTGASAHAIRGYWDNVSEVLRNRALNVAILLTFLATFTFAGMEATFAMWSERQLGWGPQQNGYLFAFIGALSALIQGTLIGPLTRRFGEGAMIVQGAVALALGSLAIPLCTSLFPLLAAMTVLAYGFSVITPSLNSLISFRADQGSQGAVFGATRAASTFARAVGPAWAGFLFAGLGRHWPFVGGAVVMGFVTVISLRLLRPKPRAGP